MLLIDAGPHYNAIRQLIPRIFPVAVDTIARQPVAWWKGEDNFIDSIQPGLPLVPENEALDPRFIDGTIGRCFIVDSQGDLDSLTVEPQGKSNIGSFTTWELELYVKFDSLSGWFYLFQAYDADGSDYIEADIQLEDDYLEIANHEVGIGDPYPKFENLGLQSGVWYKINLIYTKATNKWQCFIDDVEKTSSDIDTMAVTSHDYTIFFSGADWNSPVLHVDEIKIFTGAPAPGTTLISHWPGEDSPADIISGHDMLGLATNWNYPVAIPGENYQGGVVGRAFAFTNSLRGITPSTPDLSLLNSSVFSIEMYSKINTYATVTPVGHIYKTAAPGSLNSCVSFVIWGEVYSLPNKGFALRIYSKEGDVDNLGFYFPDHDAWINDTPFKFKLTYNNGLWHVFVNDIEVPNTDEDISHQIVDDESGSAWYFNNYADEIKIFI
jgi:hypothetical protein